jgi:C-3',4' desaturase CrtD
MKRCIIIGAGIGGLATAAVLARRGLNVTVLEAQVYPGGCAGTFYHQGYRFDAGATVAGGFYPGGPMDLLAKSTGITRWPATPVEPAMRVHLPNNTLIDRRGDERRWEERLKAFGPQAVDFWQWQERTADAMWDLALRLPSWPPKSVQDVMNLIQNGLSWLGVDALQRIAMGIIDDAVQPISRRLKGASEDLRLFVDAQLLISAQTTSQYANALFGAAALDLPRRGVVHLGGGMGSMAQELVQALERHGGQIHFRQEATRVLTEKGDPVAVETKSGHHFDADMIVFNLPVDNIAPLITHDLSGELRKSQQNSENRWSAFVVYLGVDENVIPKDLPLHHQIIAGRPLGEGNSVFLSISPYWDPGRAPPGKRAVTMSTHTLLEPWWQLHSEEPLAYKAKTTRYAHALITSGERVLPGLRESAELVLPGTPVTFQRFTGRARGWVGGYPQTHLLRFRAPRLSPNLWMVGDSIFPGQSSAAVALGGLRVANMILREHFSHSHRPEMQLPAAAGD